MVKDLNTRRGKSPFIYAGWVLKISFGFVLPILAGFFLGAYLDRLAGSSPWITLILLLAGVASGFGWLYRMSTKSGDDG